MSATPLATLVRWRNTAAVLAVVLPVALGALFVRQQRRLADLAENGQPVEALVTDVNRDDIVSYTYEVAGRTYRWSARREDLLYAPGERFTALYAPSDPSMTRPSAERPVIVAELDHSRRVGATVLIALALGLGVLAILAHRDVMRRASGHVPPPMTPERYRQRLWRAGGVIAILVAGVSALHLRDALARGESPTPVYIAAAMIAVIVGVQLTIAARLGPDGVRPWTQRLARGLLPVALAIAALRVVMLLFHC